MKNSLYHLLNKLFFKKKFIKINIKNISQTFLINS